MRKNPNSSPVVGLVVAGGVLAGLYYFLRQNCASGSPMFASVCSALSFSTATAVPTAGPSVTPASAAAQACIDAFKARVLAAAGGNATLASQALAAMTPLDVQTILSDCTAGTPPPIFPDMQQVLTPVPFPVPVSVPVPVSMPPVSAGGLLIPSTLTVTPDINNSLKGVVVFGGVPITINVIPKNAANSSGIVYNTAGQDITGEFTSAQIQQLIAAFVQASAGPGMNGLGRFRAYHVPAAMIHSGGY